jgi:hypothetical protein
MSSMSRGQVYIHARCLSAVSKLCIILATSGVTVKGIGCKCVKERLNGVGIESVRLPKDGVVHVIASEGCWSNSPNKQVQTVVPFEIPRPQAMHTVRSSDTP